MSALVAVPVLALPAFAGPDPDTVRLRSGQVLSGSVRLDDSNPEGFRVEPWETGGSVFVRWSQITDRERARLTGRGAAGRSAEVMIAGVRVLTASRDLVGVLVREDAASILLKTRDQKAAIAVPKSAFLHPLEKLQIPEAEAYSADERVDLRAARASDKDYRSLVEVADFASSVGLHERAKDLYLKALAVDPSRKPELEAVLAHTEKLLREAKASALVAQVGDLVRNVDFPKALETAQKLQADYPDTEVARQNAGLAADVQAKAKAYQDHRTEYLAQNVPEEYRERRSALVAQYAGPKFKVTEALAKAAGLDEEIVAYLARKMQATPEEIAAAWAKRELKTSRTAGYADGTWIVRGGQDGGLDTDAKTQPAGTNPNGTPPGGTGTPGGFGRMGRTGGTNSPNNPKNQPQPLGKKMETKDDWWAAASTSEKRSFLEAEYAKTSSVVTKEVKTRKCSLCNGEGIRKEVRQGVVCDCKCLRCHGVKEDESVVYR